MSELMFNSGDKISFGPMDLEAETINVINNYGEVQTVPAKDAHKYDSEIAWTDAMEVTYPKNDKGEQDD